MTITPYFDPDTPYLTDADLTLIVNQLGAQLSELGRRSIFRMLIDMRCCDVVQQNLQHSSE